ncbi:post-GPI attachment to proteins factor 4-like [Protopterus annectens]|uniref:post-GPI attachment to proteins factor 4-like n=1 Tax=Protopterus annectens TaxID=7888 RepID=UPI001CFA8302|nr:post-GPI attachment to proteins factor 4-like [Protopterus annectens]XP_043939957.1 post-GPI attachment to proteins factor 4-like [Protopterus annectens]
MVWWRSFISLYCCRSSAPFQLFLFTVVTFGVVLPVVCHRLLYSYYYLKKWYLSPMSHDFLKKNLKEAEDAVQYFQRMHPEILQSPKAQDERFPKPWLVVTVVTVQRKAEYHYLMQVVAKFHQLLQNCSHCGSNRILLCNVQEEPEHNEDARVLKKFFPTIERFKDPKDLLGFKVNSQFEKEKQDYQYCMNNTLSRFDPKYVLMVEDDAVPEDDIFNVLHHLLTQRKSKTKLENALYIKLFHPERLQRYINPEPMRILEWIGVGMSVGSLLTFLYLKMFSKPEKLWQLFLYFMIYIMLLVELVGRHYFLELRRLSPQFYSLVPVTECCTQAMLFSAQSAQRALGYLDTVQCQSRFAKDTALYSFLWERHEYAFVVEPNLVRHIGLFSTLRGLTIDPKLL